MEFTRSPSELPHRGQWEEPCGGRPSYHLWQAPVQTLASSMKLGVALTKPRPSSKQTRRGGGKLRSILLPAKSRSSRRRRTLRKRRRLSTTPLKSLVHNKPSHGNSAPR